MKDRKQAKKIYEEIREKLIREHKKKQEEMLRKDQETNERKQKKKSLEERWAMIRWITRYIDENSERWSKEKLERQKNEVKLAEDWNRMTRFDKIRVNNGGEQDSQHQNQNSKTPQS